MTRRWAGIPVLGGGALRYGAAHERKVGAVWRFVAVFLLAVALRTVWDSVGTIPVYIVLSAISLGLLTWSASGSRGRRASRPRFRRRKAQSLICGQTGGLWMSGGTGVAAAIGSRPCLRSSS